MAEHSKRVPKVVLHPQHRQLLMFELFITQVARAIQPGGYRRRYDGPWVSVGRAGGDLDACHMTPINRFNCALTDAVTWALYLRRFAFNVSVMKKCQYQNECVNEMATKRKRQRERGERNPWIPGLNWMCLSSSGA